MKNKKAFTLLELLVVVLIIGILAAIALPQYKKAVEKARMAEAVTIVKAIAQAHQRYYMINGNYLSCRELDAIDIDLGGSSDCSYPACTCRQTSNFIYLSNNYGGSYIAFAQRRPLYKYYIYVTKNEPNLVKCSSSGSGHDYQPSQTQKELCDKLNKTGTL